MLRILFHPKATKELLKIPKNYRVKILEKITELKKCSHPLQQQHIIKLGGGREDFRLRVGDYRIKFTFRKPNQILITHIQHRQVGY